MIIIYKHKKDWLVFSSVLLIEDNVYIAFLFIYCFSIYIDVFIPYILRKVYNRFLYNQWLVVLPQPILKIGIPTRVAAIAINMAILFF